MSFRNDQWYNLYAKSGGDITGESLSQTEASSKGSGFNVYGSDNQSFIYPNRQIRVLNPDDSNGGHSVINMKRGYIRSLTTAENKTGLPSRKCQFQFNPQYLVQSVSQNTSILNFLQQDPSQYAQPIPGNVSFSFELLFDRSAELNNWKPSDSFDPTNPWEKSDPSNVGVLHDIAAFYSVIGVGLSSAMNDYAEKVLERQINAAVQDKLLQQDGEDTSYDADSEYASSVESASDFLKYNAGNTAFLLPLPVRVVFSSLYIVEGLVKDVTVTFTKFNAAMVPMQCTLNVLFEAKYIGFAKKDTFFTQVLQAYEDSQYSDYNTYTGDATSEEINDAYDQVTKDLSNITIFAVDSDGGFSASSTGGSGSEFSVWSLISFEKDDQHDREVENASLRLGIGFPDAKSSSSLVDLVQTDNKSVSVSVSASCELWRYTDTFKNANKDLFSNLTTTSVEYGPGWYAGTTGSGADTAALAPLGSTIPAYNDDRKEASRKIIKALKDWSGVGASPYHYSESGGRTSLALFKNVQRIWTLVLDDSTVDLTYDDAGNVMASGDADLVDMFGTGILSKKQLPVSNNGFYDRSIASNTYPEHKYGAGDAAGSGDFYYAIQYKVTLSIEIDGYPIEQTVYDYLVPTYKGFGDSKSQSALRTTKRIEFKWESDAPADERVYTGADAVAVTDINDPKFVAVF